MKPAPFTYHRATSLDDAIAQLDDREAIVRPLAGGQSLVPMLNLRLAPLNRLVDLAGIEALARVEEQGDRIWYGALLPHAAFEDRRVPDGSNGLMSFVGGQIAYRAVRTRGTIGGAISLADPAADWLVTVVALEADIVVVGPNGRRSVPAMEFVVGPYMTTLEHAELIEAIVVPRRPTSERWGHYKATRKVGEYGESIAIALHDVESGLVRLVLGAADGAPIVLARTADMLRRKPGADRLSEAIIADLTASGRDFSPAKLRLHRTVILRAIQNAGTI